MGLANVGEKILIFKRVEGSTCTCDGCIKTMRKLLLQIRGIGKIDFNKAEWKLIIHGSNNVDPNMVIRELGTKRTFELVTEDYPSLDEIKEEKIIVHQREVLSNKASSVVLYEQPAHNQVSDEASSAVLYEQPAHNQVSDEASSAVLHEQPAHNQVSDKVSSVVLREQPAHNQFSDEVSSVVLHEQLAHNQVSNEASSVVLYEQPAHNQVVDLPGLSITPRHFRPDHDHELELKNYDKRFTCDGCKEDGFRKRYRCKHCNYELHEDCMHQKPTVSHELFKGADFKFCHEKPTCGNLCRVHIKSCEACGNGIHGYSYHCEAKGLYLHPMCVNFRGKICIDGETFALKNKGTFKCFWCDANEKTKSGWSYVSERTKCQLHVNCVAKIAHEAWKERDIGGGNDAYIMVLEKRLNWGLVKNNKGSEWSKGGKLVKMILVFARTVIGILLGDPTVILASMLVEVFKK